MTRGWLSALALVAVILFTSWVIVGKRNGGTVSGDCPVSPYSSPPPDYARTTVPPVSGWFGNGTLWMGAVIAYSGNWYPRGMKVASYRDAVGRLDVTGNRLDAPAPPLRVTIPVGYGAAGFQPVNLDFPTEGCWQVVARLVDPDTRAVIGEELRFTIPVLPAEAKPAGL